MSEKIKRKRALNVPALAGIWYTASSFLERGSAIIFTPIYTRLLSVEEYGIYSVYNGLLGIISVFSTLQISGGAIYRGLCEFENKDGFISSALGLITVSGTVSFLLYLLFSDRFGFTDKLGLKITLVLFIQAFLSGIRLLRSSQAKLSYDKRESFIESTFFSIAVPILSILLILTIEEKGYARIYAMLIASAFFAAPIIFRSVKASKGRLFDKEYWRFLLRYTIPMLPHYFSMALIWQIGKIIVAKEFTSAEAGIFSLAISIGLLPTMLTMGIQSALIPWIMRKLRDSSRSEERIYSLMLSLFSPICTIILLFLIICPEVLRVMGGDNYFSALNAVYPIAASVPLVFLSNLLSSVISHYKKTYFITLGSTISALFLLICNLLFTSKLGFSFSALIIVPTFILLCAIYFLVLKLKYKHNQLSIKAFSMIYSFFALSVFLAFVLKTSFLARLFYFLAALMLLLPELKKLKPLLVEQT